MIGARLVVFSGSPGVGKSMLAYAVARRTGWAVVAKDAVDRALETTEISYSPLAGYKTMLSLADLNLRLGVSIILDAVFALTDFRQELAAMAERHGAHFRPVACHCGDTALWRQRVEARPEMVAGWTPADWAEVQRVCGYYQPWSGPHLALDAADLLDHNLALLYRYLDLTGG